MDHSIDIFSLVIGAPTLILGLGVSRLMSDAVTLFRSRHRARIDWVPILWAISIFLIQIQFLWGIIELHGVRRTWTAVDFGLLFGMALFLYMAAALVLPDLELASGEALDDNFMRDGRWSLLGLFFAELLAVALDFRLFDHRPTLSENLCLAATTAMPLVFLLGRSRRAREWSTLAGLAVVLWNVWQLSPRKY